MLFQTYSKMKLFKSLSWMKSCTSVTESGELGPEVVRESYRLLPAQEGIAGCRARTRTVFKNYCLTEQAAFVKMREDTVHQIRQGSSSTSLTGADCECFSTAVPH